VHLAPLFKGLEASPRSLSEVRRSEQDSSFLPRTVRIFIQRIQNCWIDSKLVLDGVEKIGVFLKGVSVTSPSKDFLLVCVLTKSGRDSITLCDKYTGNKASQRWILSSSVRKSLSMIHDCLFHACTDHPWSEPPFFFFFLFFFFFSLPPLFLLFLVTSFCLLVENLLVTS